jgi:NAD-dependent dihydropyrimidine dehydrogenase PreA subunit
MSGMTEAKKPDQKQDRGQLRIDEEECKGCGLCIEACPPKVIAMSERLNHYGYRTALYAGAGCTGCGICFMACPEPGAITVYRLVAKHEARTSDSHPFRSPGRTEKDGATATAAGGANECASN